MWVIDNDFTEYASCLDTLGIVTLEERELTLIDSFLAKAIRSERFSGKWFIKKQTNSVSLVLVYQSSYALICEDPLKINKL